ncbi:MAG: penicillin-binding protein 2 [Holosporales bacterium]|jgi:cell division protein FtsI (penicillin-binding protein 3)|nr:penicillin-binding protein 2 [Holosporales bacterium]
MKQGTRDLQRFLDKYCEPLRQSIEKCRQRIVFGMGLFVLLASIIITRLFQVMVIEENLETPSHSLEAPLLRFSRADIIDRRGVLIATSLPTVSVYANPRELLDPIGDAQLLAKTLSEVNLKELMRRFASKKGFVWVKHHITPTEQKKVLRLGIPGVYFQKTERRVYPDGNLFAHIVGLTDIDNRGIAGAEKAFDSALSSSPEPVSLAVDSVLQYAVREILLDGIQEFSAIGAAGVVMDLKTGEILSLVSLPDFDPNRIKIASPQAIFNRVTCAVFEPGSAAKVLNTALALASGKITVNTRFDTRESLRVGRFTIHDYYGKERSLTVAEILKYSSNIGSAKMALEMGPTVQRAFFAKLGLLSLLPFELCEIQAPLYPKQWREINTITISYGHGIAFNPLQFAAAIGGIINEGVYHAPTILKTDISSAGSGRRVIPEDVSRQVRTLMRLVVTEGTSRKAEVKEYLVLGKTGSAEKVRTGRKEYKKDANICTFVGAFPFSAPRYLIYVLLDEPKATKNTFGHASAGWNAAVVAARVIERVGPVLGLPPIKTSEEISEKKEVKCIHFFLNSCMNISLLVCCLYKKLPTLRQIPVRLKKMVYLQPFQELFKMG